jgi:hypothetical protein
LCNCLHVFAHRGYNSFYCLVDGFSFTWIKYIIVPIKCVHMKFSGTYLLVGLYICVYIYYIYNIYVCVCNDVYNVCVGVSDQYLAEDTDVFEGTNVYRER